MTASGSTMRLSENADDAQGAASGNVCWSTVAGLVLIHAAGVCGVVWIVVNPSLPTLVLAGLFYVVCGLSVTAGYHRLFAHRTYRPAAAVRWVLLAFGAATFQNSALSWSADHRAHHADTDGDGDPHPVTRGAWFAHVGWLFRRRQASADVTLLKDLWAVRSIRLQHRYYPAVAVGVGLVLPAVIAAQWGDLWGGLLVAGFLRAAVMLQATFCVNSLAHLVGTRRYDAALVGARQRPQRPGHLRRGLSQLPSPLLLRLPQWPSLVALRPEQVADLDARQDGIDQRVADRLTRNRRQGLGVGPRLGLTRTTSHVRNRAQQSCGWKARARLRRVGRARRAAPTGGFLGRGACEVGGRARRSPAR